MLHRRAFVGRLLGGIAIAAVAGSAWSAVPVLHAASCRRGALTRATAGDVPLSALMLTSGTGIIAWTCTLTGGTAGHWSEPTAGMSPTPTTAGVSAGLNGGPYTFSVTATNSDGVSSAATLTINVVANVATVAKPSDIDSTSTGIRNATFKAGLGGKTVEVAKGSDDNWTNALPTVAVLRNFTTHTGRFVITSEDTANPTKMRRFTGNNNQRIDVVDLDCQHNLASNNTSSNAQNSGVMIDFSATGGPCIDMTFTRINTSAPAGTTSNQWVSGFFCRGDPTSSGPLNDGIIFTACRATRVKDGFKLSDATNCSFDTCVVDSFCSNAHFWSRRLNNNSRNDCITVRAFQNLADLTDHCDAGQVGGGATADIVGNSFVREIYSIANGDKAAQGIGYNDDTAYTGGVVTGFLQNTTNYQNIFSDTPASQGFHFESGSGWDVRYITNVVGLNAGALRDVNNNPYSAPVMSAPVGVAIPGLLATGICVNNVVVSRAFSLPSCFPTVDTDNTVLANVGAPPSGNWTEALRIAYFSAYFNDPGRIINFSSLTAEQIAAELRIAWRPKAPLMNVGGTYRGCFFPDGSWNDGTVYGATGPTTISASCPVTTVNVNAPATVTYQLDAPATLAVTITPAKSGVSGAFSPTTVVIPIGQVSGTTDFTPTTAGAASMTATNNRGLAGPSALPLAVTAAANPPTLYTQVSSAAVAVPGTTITVVYTLDQLATTDVTITPTCSLPGNFSTPTVIIPVGTKTGFVTFTVTGVGTGQFTATNNRSLTDPAALPLVSTRVTKGQLRALGIVPA